MTEATRLFEERVSEVELYFKFLRQILDSDVQLYFPRKKSWNRRPVDPDTGRILKATAFLVLYNLVEATARSVIRGIHEACDTKTVNFGDAREELRKLWVRSRLQHLAKSGGIHSSYLQVAEEIADAVLANHGLGLTDDAIAIGGNLDARKLRELCKRYGMGQAFGSAQRSAEKLQTVKERRNQLAHGLESFVECGRNYSPDDLFEIQRAVVSFMKAFLRSASRYVGSERYLAAKA